MRDKWQFTPLHSAANGGHVSTIRKLIQFSHEVDAKDYLGECSVTHAQFTGPIPKMQGAKQEFADCQGVLQCCH